MMKDFESSNTRILEDDNAEDALGDTLFREYNIMKYILMLIPIFLSCLLFVFLDGSFSGMLKIISGYTVVFSMFLLSSEEIYIHIKTNILRMFITFSMLLLVFLIGGICMHFMDLYLMNSVSEVQYFIGVKFNPLPFIVGFTQKVMYSAFLLLFTFWINLLILVFLIKFDVANMMLERFKSE